MLVMRGRDEQLNCKLHDFKDKGNYFEYTERSTKTRTGETDDLKAKRKYNNKIFKGSGDERDPYLALESYLRHRPEGPGVDAFYLQPIDNPKGTIWYKTLALKRDGLGNIMKRMAETAGIQHEGNFTNTSGEKQPSKVFLSALVVGPYITKCEGMTKKRIRMKKRVIKVTILGKRRKLFRQCYRLSVQDKKYKYGVKLGVEQRWKLKESSSSNLKNFDTTGVIDALVKSYNQAESWQTKRQILSLFANDFSRSQLQDMIPGLSKWRIDQARQHAIETGKGQPVASQQVFRQRIDELQIDHFLDFISRPEFLQDVPFGTKTLKLDSGEKIHIPAIIRTLIPSRIIAQYTRLCAQQQFEPAGERSLFRILEVCSASLQKSLQGLDSVTADGTEAFDNMVAIVDTLAENGAGNDWRKNVEVGLRDGKRYLKTDFKSHVGRDEKCSDHCVTYALSDNTTASYQIDCEHTHDTVCEQCINLDKVFEDMSQKMEEVITDQEQKDRITYEYTESVGAIYAWKAHLLRLLNQEEAKQDILFSLDDQECFKSWTGL
ncbi:hypothetical protein QZH41_000536 [Actinostola sp. cb2023]|nr:hypothetical protein QZH41_000536 [Actinostola sp. cb2023]